MSDKVSDWTMMWGAKVKVRFTVRTTVFYDVVLIQSPHTLPFVCDRCPLNQNPCDMPDDILKDSISASIQILSTINSSAPEAEESICIEKIKTHMDENWEPGWVVVVGRSLEAVLT